MGDAFASARHAAERSGTISAPLKFTGIESKRKKSGLLPFPTTLSFALQVDRGLRRGCLLSAELHSAPAVILVLRADPQAHLIAPKIVIFQPQILIFD